MKRFAFILGIILLAALLAGAGFWLGSAQRFMTEAYSVTALEKSPPILADIVGGWEIGLIVAVILILIGARKLPELLRGLGEGFSEFRRSLGFVSKELDQAAHDAGESLGGIYGKPAAEALTPDNRTAEFYNPAALHKPDRTSRGPKHMRFRSWSRWCQRIWDFVSKRF